MNAIDFNKKAALTTSINELNQLLDAFFQQFDIQYYSFTYYPSYNSIKTNNIYEYFSPKYKTWHQHYQESNYKKVDNNYLTQYQQSLPIYFNVSDQIDTAKTDKEKKMRIESYQFGAREGMVIPIHNTKCETATMVVVRMHDDQPWDWNSLKTELLFVSHSYFIKIQSHLVESYKKSNLLSKREVQTLTLLSENKSLESIADTLNIKPRTVNFHIQNINNKLNVKNKHLAVLKATRMKLL